MGTLVETDIDHFIRERKAKLQEEKKNFGVGKHIQQKERSANN